MKRVGDSTEKVVNIIFDENRKKMIVYLMLKSRIRKIY